MFESCRAHSGRKSARLRAHATFGRSSFSEGRCERSRAKPAFAAKDGLHLGLMSRAAVAGAAAIVAIAAGFGGTVGTATVACSARSFTVSFSPQRDVVVTARGTTLGSASFTRRWVSPRCDRVAEPRRFADGGLGGEIRRRVVLRCSAPRSIRIHVNPILNGDTDKIVGSNLVVGTGEPLRTIVSAVLKNKGDPYASRIYRAAAYCTFIQ